MTQTAKTHRHLPYGRKRRGPADKLKQHSGAEKVSRIMVEQRQSHSDKYTEQSDTEQPVGPLGNTGKLSRGSGLFVFVTHHSSNI